MNLKIEPGHCWLSGKKCFEILESYQGSHLLAGHVRKIGRPLPEAYKVVLLFIDGSIGHVTIHESCIEDVVKNLNPLWHSICERTLFEWREREAFGVRKDEKTDKLAISGIISKTLDNPPIDVLAISRWSEER